MSTENPPVKKKLKVDEEIVDATWWISFQMKRLAEQWNQLGFCPFTWVYQGGHESDDQNQGGYLTDMEEICKTGSASYCNPFGESAREAFGYTFVTELKSQEKQVFLHLAKESIQSKRPISKNNIVHYVSNGPFIPVHVELDRDDKQFQNGSERFPFSSIKKAEEQFVVWDRDYKAKASVGLSRYDGPWLKLKCGKECTRRRCFFPGCNIRICDEHGDGIGMEDFQGYGRGDLCFYRCKCLSCDKVACSFHERLWNSCDVCSNGYSAGASLGAYNYSPNACFKVCNDCGEVCNLNGDGEEDSDKEKTCGFYCCRWCIEDHKCFDDPTLYC